MRENIQVGMLTIGEVLVQGTRTLVVAGLESAQLDAQVLLGHVLDLERVMLYAYPEREVSAEQVQQYELLIERRRRHEPVAYLLGHKEFYGLNLLVDRRVLIPRPETELLVERGLELIRERIAVGYQPVVADIGTGSGAIPIAIAVEEPRLSTIYACDISGEALQVAHLNAQRNAVVERIRFLHGDLVAPLPEPVDILLANLPYVGTVEMPHLASDVVAYEPHHALFSGPHGLVLLQRMCREVQQFGTLKEGGVMLLEVGYQQCMPLTNLLLALWPGATVICKKDYAGWDRLIEVRI